MSAREHAIKAVITHPLGISFSMEIEGSNRKVPFYSKRVGNEIDGEEIGWPHYIFTIEGGSDLAGFPHQEGIRGETLKRVLTKTSPPRREKVAKKTSGHTITDLRNVRLKKRVRGENLSEWTRQVNLVISERKETPIEEMTVDEILSEEILQPIARKLGHVILRWGLKGVKVIKDDSKASLGKEISTMVEEESLNEAKERIGAEFLRIKERKQELFNQLQKVRINNPPLLGARVAQAVGDVYKQMKRDEEIEEPVDYLVGKITTLIKEAEEGTLKKREEFPFKIEEVEE